MADLGTNSKGYKLKGRVNVQGLPVAVENPKGSVREGENEDGFKWRTKFRFPYGYIEDTKGADGEEVDAYVGPDEGSTKAYVVEQKKDDGSYDEDTVMLGFSSKAKAVRAIHQHYDDPKYIGKTRTVPVEKLKKELKKTAEKVPEEAEAHTITLKAMGEAMPNVSRVLLGLQQMGRLGASREITTEDKDFQLGSFDGDGPDKIYDLKVDGKPLKKDMKKKAEAAPAGFYKGQPTSPGTVKFKTEFRGIPINVDRPRGFIMKGTDAKGNAWVRRYRYDYGFIPKTLGGDNDGLDVFIGPQKRAPNAFWVVQRKDDGSFDEYKVFLGFPDRDAATAAYRQHIPKKYFKGIITMKIEMMKAMLGKVNPDEKIKRASISAMLDELGWIMRTL